MSRLELDSPRTGPFLQSLRTLAVSSGSGSAASRPLDESSGILCSTQPWGESLRKVIICLLSSSLVCHVCDRCEQRCKLPAPKCTMNVFLLSTLCSLEASC